MKPERTGVKRVIGKNQSGALLRRQPILDKGEIAILVAAVKLVADDGMAEVREVDANLVLAAGAGNYSQERVS